MLLRSRIPEAANMTMTRQACSQTWSRTHAAWKGAPVLELGNVDGALHGSHRDEVTERALGLWDGRHERGLRSGAHVGQLRHETQPLKVDVGAAGDGHHRLALSACMCATELALTLCVRVYERSLFQGILER